MSVDVMSAVLRALALIGVFQATGGSITLCLFPQDLTPIEAAVRRLSFSAAAGSILLLVLQYLLEAGRMAGDLSGTLDADLQALAAHSTLAVALAWRIVGLALIGIGMRIAARLGNFLGLTGAIIALVAFTLTGHTATSDLRWLLSLFLLLHVLIVALWIGVLPPLFMLARRDTVAARALAADFSRLALWLVPLIPALGIALAFGLMATAAAWLSPYGLLLFGKLIGFALLMIFAALNKLRLVNALSATTATAAGRLRISVGIEYGLIATVLAITALLTTFQSPQG